MDVIDDKVEQISSWDFKFSAASFTCHGAPAYYGPSHRAGPVLTVATKKTQAWRAPSPRWAPVGTVTAHGDAAAARADGHGRRRVRGPPGLKGSSSLTVPPTSRKPPARGEVSEC